jgi:hypothetical protein
MPRTPIPTDPRLAPIQVTFRIPWYWKMQLDRIAAEKGTTTPQLMIDAVEEVHPPGPMPPMPEMP